MADREPTNMNKPSPAEASLQPTLNVMTYNIFGLKYIAGHRSARIREIGREICQLSPPPHIVCLQECFTEDDYLAIRRATGTILPHGRLFYSGFFGAGLAILSCWPIQESCMYPYPLNGRPTGFFRGDWYVGKGVGWARIRVPESFLTSALPSQSSMHDPLSKNEQIPTALAQPKMYVSVYTTHLHAPYHFLDDHSNAYLPHRTFQSWFLSTLLRGSLDRGDLVLAGGDFNSLPASLPHRILTARGGLHDVWRALHPSSSWGPVSDPRESRRGRPVPSAVFNRTENGATSDTEYNTWRWPKDLQKKQYSLGSTGEAGDAAVISRRRHIPDETPDPRGKRLDYIFFGHCPHYQDESAQSLRQWRLQSAHVGMTTLHPNIHCSLSDHFAVHASFALSPVPAPEVLADYKSDTDPLTAEELLHTLSLIAQERAHISALRRTHLSSFALSVGVIFPACAIGVWWVPVSGLAFLLVVVAAFAMAAAVVSGLIGGLWCWGEGRAWGGWEDDVKGMLDEVTRSDQGEAPSAYDKSD